MFLAIVFAYTFNYVRLQKLSNHVSQPYRTMHNINVLRIFGNLETQ